MVYTFVWTVAIVYKDICVIGYRNSEFKLAVCLNSLWGYILNFALHITFEKFIIDRYVFWTKKGKVKLVA